MRKKQAGILMTLCVVGLVACTTVEDNMLGEKVDSMTACEKVQALVQGHKQGFPALRGQQSTVKYMQIWRAKYHLAGEACQIWGWGQGKFSYVCSILEPNKQVALAHFQTSKETVQACLGQEWQSSEMPRQNGEGLRMDVSKPGEKTTITIMAAATETLMKDEWRTYFFVGDPNDTIQMGK